MIDAAAARRDSGAHRAVVGVVAVLAVVFAILSVKASAEGPARLYLRSENGGYAEDLAADPAAVAEQRAPAGSKAAASAPSGEDGARAVIGASPESALRRGLPDSPTFGFDFAGAVSSLCFDVWVEGPPNAAEISLYFALVTADGTAKKGRADLKPYEGSVQRLVGRVALDAPVTTTAQASLVFYNGGAASARVVHYDSATYFSSVTPNVAGCAATPLPVPTSSPEPTEPPDPEPTDPEPTDPEPTDPEPTDPEPTDPGPTSPATPSPSVPPMESWTRYTGPDTVTCGTKPLLSATVHGATGEPVTAGSVTFKVSTWSGSGTVRSSGAASATYPVWLAPGDRVLMVDYSGSPRWYASGIDVGLRIVRGTSRLTLQRSVVSGKSRLTATVRTAGGMAVSGKAVTFYRNGARITRVNTDTTGRAVVTTTIGKRGDRFTASWSGDSCVSGASAHVRI